MSIDTDIGADIDDTDLDEKVEQSLDILGRIEAEFDVPVFTCSFGKDSNVVLDLADRAGLDPGEQTAAAFTDHGNHFEETWAVKEELEAKYDITFETYEPESSYEDLVEEHGPLVNQRKPDLCCLTLKSATMERVIDGHDGWITGYRIAESWAARTKAMTGARTSTSSIRRTRSFAPTPSSTGPTRRSGSTTSATTSRTTRSTTSGSTAWVASSAPSTATRCSRTTAPGGSATKPERPATDRVGWKRLPVRPHAIVRSIPEGLPTDPMSVQACRRVR